MYLQQGHPDPHAEIPQIRNRPEDDILQEHAHRVRAGGSPLEDLDQVEVEHECRAGRNHLARAALAVGLLERILLSFSSIKREVKLHIPPHFQRNLSNVRIFTRRAGMVSFQRSPSCIIWSASFQPRMTPLGAKSAGKPNSELSVPSNFAPVISVPR